MYANWYPDPTGLPFQRYWDGVQWTEATRPQPPIGGPFAPPPVPPARRQWWQRKAVLIPTGILGGLIVIAALAPSEPKSQNDAQGDQPVAAMSSPEETTSAPTQSEAAATSPAAAAKASKSSTPASSAAAKPKSKPQHHATATTSKDDGSFRMPDERGQNLQDAQDDIQRVSGDPVFYSHSHDLLGSRMQILDSGWQVCTQNVPAGAKVSAIGHIDFGVVRVTESCP